MKPRTLTLAETLAGVERAHKRVERWPQWKRDVSCFKPTDFAERDDGKFMTQYIVARVNTSVLYFEVEASSDWRAEELVKEGEGFHKGSRIGVPQCFCVPSLPKKKTP